MSLKRFQQLSRYVHVVDNNEKIKDENKNDKLFKIGPVLNIEQLCKNTAWVCSLH